MHKSARSLLNWQLFLFVFSKGRESIEGSVFYSLGVSKDKMALGQVNPPCRELLRAAEGECFAFSRPRYVFFSAEASFQGEAEMY